MSDEWTTIEPNQAEPEEKIEIEIEGQEEQESLPCLLYTSPSPRD